MLQINFHPFKNLETNRLILRRINQDDVFEIFKLRSNPETMKYIPRPLAKTSDDALEHIKIIDERLQNNEGINWGITIKGNSKLIGIIGHYRIKSEDYRSEIGYMLLPDFEGKGLMTEAINVVLKYGFEDLKLHSTEAIIDPRNKSSERVLQKNGMIKEAHLIENGFYDGEFLDTVIYSILKRNFIK
jgi:[ribosomal protein S5]-alanine N-acetyltransferase